MCYFPSCFQTSSHSRNSRTSSWPLSQSLPFPPWSSPPSPEQSVPLRHAKSRDPGIQIPLTDTHADQLPPLSNGAVRKKLLDVARLAGLVRTIEVGLPPDVGILPAGRSAQIYTVRQCVTSTFDYFTEHFYSEKYFTALKISNNPTILVYWGTSQTCINPHKKYFNYWGCHALTLIMKI